MNSRQWCPENAKSVSLTNIPKTVVVCIIIRFLGEDEAFMVRGTCKLFSTTYFNQEWKRVNGRRVVSMLRKGYQYPRLKVLSVHKYYCGDKHYCWSLSFLQGLPTLSKLEVTRFGENENYSIVHKPQHTLVKRLGCRLADFSMLARMPMLEITDDDFGRGRLHMKSFPKYLDDTVIQEFRFWEAISCLSDHPSDFCLRLNCNPGLGNVWPSVYNFPPNLESLIELEMIECSVVDLSGLSCFPKRNLLRLNSNAPDLETLPHNLTCLSWIELCKCDLDDLSPLARCPFLETLVLDNNPNLQIATLPTTLSEISNLYLSFCNLRDLSHLSAISTSCMIDETIPNDVILIRY